MEKKLTRSTLNGCYMRSETKSREFKERIIGDVNLIFPPPGSDPIYFTASERVIYDVQLGRVHIANY